MLLFKHPVGVCYAYDISKKAYDQRDDSFHWDWTVSKIKYFDEQNKKRSFSTSSSKKNKWEVTGLMGPNVLFNKDGIVFGTPLARPWKTGLELFFPGKIMINMT